MVAYFEISKGLPPPLVQGALEMFFSENGNGGRVGFSKPETMRRIVMIDNQTVATHFRVFMEQRRVEFTSLGSVSPMVAMDIIHVPTHAEVNAQVQRLLRAIFGS